MLYSNPEFVLLFVATFLVYVVFPIQKVRLAALLLSSFIYLAWAGLLDTVLFIGVIVFAWLSLKLGNLFPKYRKTCVVIGVVGIALNLLFWKYSFWIVAQVQRVYPEFMGGEAWRVPLPIGISFFTLQGIAFLVDAYKGQIQSVSLSQYTVFKAYFAQLVAGPIARHHQLLPQLNKLPTPSLSDLSRGLGLFILGFMKKILIADRVSPFVDAIFDGMGTYDRSALFLGVLGYTVQIWADFSGYTDMGRGCARMMGISLPENFLSPYLSRSPSEFWRRWHITLSQWIRDYIYIPLGGNRGSFFRVMGVVGITMGISGLWHGAAWNFVAWGLFHAMLLWGERIWTSTQLCSAMKARLPRLFFNGMAVFAMLIATLLGWLLFRSLTISGAAHYLSAFVTGSGTTMMPEGSGWVWMGVTLCFLCQGLFYYDFSKGQWWVLDKIGVQTFEDLSPTKARWVGVGIGVTTAAVLVGVLICRPIVSSPAFIYFQF